MEEYLALFANGRVAADGRVNDVTTSNVTTTQPVHDYTGLFNCQAYSPTWFNGAEFEFSCKNCEHAEQLLRSLGYKGYTITIC